MLPLVSNDKAKSINGSNISIRKSVLEEKTFTIMIITYFRAKICSCNCRKSIINEFGGGNERCNDSLNVCAFQRKSG
ncbi:hypothetical protein DERP_008429 [Dermatophagoides pteronyssinus]|uniref:Uncharacterized protein n=1 Tax=Dermatophagoides pteronyssinus TaxID=6956 RepID=A0ABQ8IVD0_DERPT|nr:hypothetical protein DERP_008429 [Dermatophagoides pteronyssinus]